MFCLLTALSLFAIQEELDPALFQPVDVFQLEVAQDPQISPDGSRVAYVRQAMDVMIDRALSSIWVVDTQGDRHRPLVQGAHTPRWSPSGDRLAYLKADKKRGVELHMRWMDTGQSAMLTNLPESPGSITWSPDGKSLAFSMFVPEKAKPLVTAPSKPEGAEWAPAPKVIERLDYRSDGGGYLETGFEHLFVLSAEGGTPRQLTSGDFDHSGPLSFSPDASDIVFSANRLEDAEYQPIRSELWTVRVADGELRQLTDRLGPDSSPTWSADGRRIAYLGYDDQKMGYHNRGVYVMEVASGDIRHIGSSIDRSIDSVRWLGNASDRLVVTMDSRGMRQLVVMGLDEDMDMLATDVGGTSLGRPYTSGGFSVANDGRIAYTRGTPLRPAEVAIVGEDLGRQQLTELNEDLFGHKRLGQVEELVWRSSVGDHDIQGWLVTPPDFDPQKQYPLILEIHGGPFAAYGPHFAAEIQLFAAAGYVVLYANPRGSTSYGFDFANEIHHNYPNQDYDDLMSGVDAAIAKGFVDPERLYVTGGSGGGVLTAWIVGKTDRFKAAVSAKPVINWTSTVLTTDIGAFMPEYWFEKQPWEDPEHYWKRSPLSLVGNVTTPTMLLTGEEDHRTPMPESEQYYQALKLRKIDSALVRIPGASHGIARRPSNLIAKVQHILAWFERYP